jgi:N-acetylglucosamine-6-phosphate deacetylase
VPRPTKRVKSFGAIDLHFHGAFGIDLMTAKVAELNSLSAELEKKGVAGFSATTLSAGESELAEVVTRLGAWIRSGSAPGARPLGIHLEGPFLNPDAAGAHPPGVLRKLQMTELDGLWTLSKETLHILTIAPETLDDATHAELTRWAAKRRVRLSIGHTRCTLDEAERAFEHGFTGVTHAWNALSYHHREPGVLGAALGRKKVWIELIPDAIHVHPAFIDWTLALHPKGAFFVSDAAPAAGTDGSHFHRFGDLECRFADRASRLPDGRLAGGGFLLPDSFRQWLVTESRRKGIAPEVLLKTHLARIHRLPLEAVFFKRAAADRLLKRFPVTWEVTPGKKGADPKITVFSGGKSARKKKR